MLRGLDQVTLPPPWVRGLLVLLFLGFGVLMGSVTSGPSTSAASPQARLELMLPTATVASAPPPAASSTPEAPPVTPTPAKPVSAGGAEPSSTGSSQGTGSGNRGAGGGKSTSKAGSGGATSGGSSKLPPVKHVFLIVLADQPYAALFGPASKATYLAGTLEKQGELLVRYYAVAHDELANGIALVSGQGPTAQTALNCPTFAEITPGSGSSTASGSLSASPGADGQVSGQGCVYPRSTETLAGQLAAKHLAWRAYVEDMTPACAHPALGAADATVGAAPLASAAPGPAGQATQGSSNQATPASAAAQGARYTTFRNPFVYFHGVIDSAAACAAQDVGMDQLGADLKSAKRTPALSYIVPSLCDDGGPTPCASGQAAGALPADAFLKKVVPQIMASKAYKQGGLLAITVDQAPATGIEADSSSCCGQPRFPNLLAPGSAGAPTASAGQLPPAGGGQVGALLLSPFVKAGSVDEDPYNHFSMLRTIEDLFGLKHLGYAGASGVSSFNAAVFAGK